jgi:hypothetical protein
MMSINTINTLDEMEQKEYIIKNTQAIQDFIKELEVSYSDIAERPRYSIHNAQTTIYEQGIEKVSVEIFCHCEDAGKILGAMYRGRIMRSGYILIEEDRICHSDGSMEIKAMWKRWVN